ncbi:TIGR03667 family PPOX class F420-dependent oxidoreductase [Actinomycetes bacterium KLBMP 9759]
MTFELPDPATEFGARVAKRLGDDVVAWLTVVDASGTPQPGPIWFLWDGETALVYSRADAKRLVHMRNNPRVSLNLDSTDGDDVVVLTGEIAESPDDPAVPDNAAYLAKYGERITKGWGTAERFASIYSVPLRLRPTRVRGF